MPDPSDHRAVLRFPYPDERRARVVHEAIRVEVGGIDDDRSTAAVGRAGDTVEVTVHARDLVALRAGVNTWTRLVETAETVAASAER
ncbi:KEOPS complex Pcc1-like subunit [Halobaculum sp. WSA2]|uniref:KEOPS complex Pcc1-like subunit n=1 Tax=Halobaculum saliterrae TaxID=2073113 RepID=A0A6B0SSR8_9EURY|nr:KEOPS complex subunit Pcc1 [Halobaculum saliterrae]MXR41934.1 KEOPS complex Pcc1-like subunit [Halobaculum saliterrae]